MQARVAATWIQKKRICASIWIVRMENNNCIPNTNNYVLKKTFYEHSWTFEVWILKMF